MEDALRNAAAFRVAGGQVADDEVLPDVGINKDYGSTGSDLGGQSFQSRNCLDHHANHYMFYKICFIFCLECLLIETTPSLPKKR